MGTQKLSSLRVSRARFCSTRSGGARLGRRLLGAVVLLFGLLGCQEKAEEDRPGGINIGTPGAPIGKPGGQGGAVDNPSEDGTVRGVVVQYLSDSFAATTAYPGRANVRIADSSGRSVVDVDYDGVDFLAEGEVLGRRWVLVDPDEDSMLTTLTMQNFGAMLAIVPVTPRAVLDQIFQNITTPVELNNARAHLLVRVVDSAGRGVAGVATNSFAGSAQVIAYKEDAVWPSYLEATTEAGLAFVPNLQAPPFPGQLVTVVLTGAIDEEVEGRLVTGAITVINVVVP